MGGAGHFEIALPPVRRRRGRAIVVDVAEVRVRSGPSVDAVSAHKIPRPFHDQHRCTLKRGRIDSAPPGSPCWSLAFQSPKCPTSRSLRRMKVLYPAAPPRCLWVTALVVGAGRAATPSASKQFQLDEGSQQKPAAPAVEASKREQFRNLRKSSRRKRSFRTRSRRRARRSRRTQSHNRRKPRQSHRPKRNSAR